MRILIATEAAPVTSGLFAPAAVGAVRIARGLSANGADVKVLGILEPLPQAEGIHLPHEREVNRARANSVHEALRREIQGLTGRGSEWTTAVEVGRAPPTIARAAAAWPADLVILPLPPRRRRGGCADDALALQVARMSPVPVLAAAPDLPTLPTRIVAAVDFSAPSVRAARSARTLLDPSGVLELVHVRPRFDFAAARVWRWPERYGTLAIRRLEQLQSTIGEDGGPEVRVTMLDGDPVDAVAEFAGTTSGSVIAAGIHGPSYRDPALTGPTMSGLLREAPGSVLIAPSLEVRAEAPGPRAASDSDALPTAALPTDRRRTARAS